MIQNPHIVWHVAAMGNWQGVASEQLLMLRDIGLPYARVTFVGNGLDWLMDHAAHVGVHLVVARSDPNTDHYETFGIMEVQRLARTGTDRPILYFHTKGVSNPGDPNKNKWRLVMERHLIRNWPENMALLQYHDCIGVNWWTHGEQHYSGNFWIANPSWLRRLPDFVQYHHAKNLVRYSCEMWVGACQYAHAYSLACWNEPFWHRDYNFDPFLYPDQPREYPANCRMPEPEEQTLTTEPQAVETGERPHVAYLVSSHFSYAPFALPRVLNSLKTAGVKPEQVFVVMCGCAREFEAKTDLGTIWYVKHESRNFCNFVEAVNPERREALAPFTHVFALMDTCEALPGFAEKTVDFDASLEAVGAHPHADGRTICDLGCYKLSYLRSLEPHIATYKNARPEINAKYEGCLYKWARRKQFYGGTGGLTYPSGGLEHPHDIYGTGTLRVTELYDAIQLLKYKSNWGQNPTLLDRC